MPHVDFYIALRWRLLLMGYLCIYIVARIMFILRTSPPEMILYLKRIETLVGIVGGILIVVFCVMSVALMVKTRSFRVTSTRSMRPRYLIAPLIGLVVFELAALAYRFFE